MRTSFNPFVFCNPSGIVKGKEELEKLFIDSVENVLPQDSDMEITYRRVSGEVAYIVWKNESRFYSIPLGTDTFMILFGC